MTFSEEWVLPRDAETYADDELVARVRALLPAGIDVKLLGDKDTRAVRVALRANDIEAVAQKLAAREGQLDWDWHRDMDPPRDEGDSYSLQIDVVDDERPLIRVYSNDEDNREAWPIAVSIAARLAEDLEAIPAEDLPDSDRIPLFIEPGKTSKLN